MIRKVYLDFIKARLSQGQGWWLLKRLAQYMLIHFSYGLGRPLCGPILGTLMVTYKCNYHCKMCDLPLKEKEFKDKGMKEFSTQQFRDILKDFAALGVSGIGFTGGEPLLREDIFDLLSYTKELSMFSHLNTNGFFLNEDNAKRIIDAKTDSVNVSLDGAKAVTHDTIRRCHGAFDKVCSAVQCVDTARRAAKAQLRLKIVCVLNQTNISEIPELITLAKKLGADYVECIPQQPFFEKDDSPAWDDKFINEVERLTEYLLKIKKQGINIENSPRDIKLFARSFKGEKSPLICYAAYNSYGVDCYGEIYPCVPWINWGKSVGNIGKTQLKDFWYSQQYNQKRKGISRCRDCYLNCQTELNLLFNIVRLLKVS